MVAPLVGAWIEITARFPLVGAWIEILLRALRNADMVAPLVGAWIEITTLQHCDIEALVAPLVGAWIEILLEGTTKWLHGRSSRGSVD